MIYLASTQLDRAVEGLPYLLLGIVGVLLALFWIFFPIVVVSRLSAIVRLLEDIRDNTAATADGARREVRTAIRKKADSE